MACHSQCTLWLAAAHTWLAVDHNRLAVRKLVVAEDTQNAAGYSRHGDRSWKEVVRNQVAVESQVDCTEKQDPRVVLGCTGAVVDRNLPVHILAARTHLPRRRSVVHLHAALVELQVDLDSFVFGTCKE